MKNIIKKALKYPCYICNPKGGGKKGTKCSTCDGKGNYIENFYYILAKDKKGRTIAFSCDTIG